MGKNNSNRKLLLLILLTRCIYANKDGGQSTMTNMALCNDTNANCTADGEQGTDLTTEVLSTTPNPFSFSATTMDFTTNTNSEDFKANREQGTSLTTEVLSTTSGPSPFSFSATTIDFTSDGNSDDFNDAYSDYYEQYYAYQDWSRTDSDDVERYLNASDAKEYIASFEEDFQKMLVQETLRFCPYMKFCNFTFGLTPPPLYIRIFEGEPCCKPCSCLADCVSEGNCCPDYHSLPLYPEMKDPDQSVTETCMPIFVRRNTVNLSPGDDMVKAYQNCPPSTDENLNFRCSRSFELFENLTLDDVTPLSNSATMKTYRNRHCAECNEVEMAVLIPWDVRLDCWGPPEYSANDDLLTDIINGKIPCHLNFLKPTTVDVNNCSHVITSCNETGMWAEFDPDIDRACAMYETIIAVDDGVNINLFKNPFCAICNGMDPSKYLCESLYGDGSPYAFSGLLRLGSPIRSVQSSSLHTACEQGFMYDHIKNRCQEVICPFLQTFKLDKCEPYLNSSNSIGIRLFSVVRPSDEISIGDLYTIMHILRAKFEKELRRRIGLICTSQTMIVLQNDSPVDSVEFMHDVLLHSGQTIDNAVEILLGLNGLNISLDSNVGRNNTMNTSREDVTLFNITLKDDIRGYNKDIPYGEFYNWSIDATPVPLEDLLNNSFIQSGHRYVPYFYWNEHPGNCFFDGEILRLVAIKPCPMFSINKTEFGLIETSYGLKFKTGGEILVGLLDYVIADKYPFVRMCVDTYKRVFNDYVKDVVGSVNPAELIVSIVSVSVSIVCLIISLFTYCFIPQIQTLPGKNNMSLIVALLLAQGMYILSSYGRFDTDSFSCKLVGGFTHFFWLLSIFWMNVCTFHMFRVLVRTRNVSGKASTNKHLLYHAYAIVLSLVFVAVNVFVSMVTSNSSDIGYGGSRCYVSTQRMLEITFGIPATIVVIANLSMFLTIIVKLKRAPTVNKNVKHERNYVIVFAKLSTITGATWVFGFVYMWTGIVAFSYIFTILNGSQGLFLMVSFVCNTRTVGMVKDRSKALTSSFARTHSTNTRPGSVHSGTKKTDDIVVK